VVASVAPAMVAGSNDFGLKFLEENKGKDGVITLKSGLQYKVLREGDGDDHPQKDTSCKCHYEGRTAQEYPEGKTFDSSYKRGDPASFAPSQVIKGWTEAMQLMVQGDKWEMYIPSELGYGEGGSGADIKGGDVLVFTMEILSIDGPTTPADRGPPPFTEVKSFDEFASWNAATGPKIVGSFRKVSGEAPFGGDLFAAFKGAAKKLKASEGAAAALTHTTLDRPTGKWVNTKIVDEFAAASAEDEAPAFKSNQIYAFKAKTGKWKKCKTSPKTLKTADEVKQSILDCALGKKKKKKAKGKQAEAPPKEEL